MQTSFILMDRLMPILKAKLRHAIPAAVVMTDSIYALSSKGLTALLLRGEFCAQRIDVDKTPEQGMVPWGNIVNRHTQSLRTMDAAAHRLFICLVCCLILSLATPCFSNEKISGEVTHAIVDYDAPVPSRMSALTAAPELVGSSRARSHRVGPFHGAVSLVQHRHNYADFITVYFFCLAKTPFTVPLPSARGFIFFSTPPPTA